MNNIRQIVLDRIEEVKVREGGFSRGRTKWQAFAPGAQESDSWVDACDVDFTAMDDETLVKYFERVMCKYYRQS